MKGRGPVVHLDRSKKARMISAILEDYLGGNVKGFRTLDIGCGNGGISEYFSRSNEHYAVDIEDKRSQITNDYEFRLVDSAQLPFENAFFDMVISHHVIEHVNDQGVHLDEIHRVLKSNGIAYLATPNKSSPIMEGHVGNDLVLRYRDMRPMFEAHKFRVQEYGMRVVKEPDHFHGEVRYGRFVPEILLKPLRPLFPSHMFILTKSSI